MLNLEYYGFSLLCYVQRECNSYFRALEKAEYERPKVEPESSALGCNLRESLIVAGPDGLVPEHELDMVQRFFGGKLGELEMEVLGDVCLVMGLGGLLWEISQWTPDRKRPVLAMVSNRSNKEILAVSGPFKVDLVSGSDDSLAEEKSSSLVVGEGGRVRVVKASTMEQLALKFADVRARRMLGETDYVCGTERLYV